MTIERQNELQQLLTRLCDEALSATFALPVRHDLHPQNARQRW